MSSGAVRVVLVTAGLALCLAGCGGGGGSGESGDASRESAREPAETQRERVAGAIERMYGAVAAGDAAGVCGSLLAQAREEVAQNVLGGSVAPPGDRTCEQSMATFLRAAATSGVLERTGRAEVVDVRIGDGVATAAVAFGGGPGGQVVLREEDGEWRFGADAMAGGAQAGRQ